MASFNKWTGLGNMTRDPELRYTPTGVAVVSFAVACNHRWTSKDGQKMEDVIFMDCQAWNKMAEIIAQWAKKGNLVLVEGRLKMEEWEDKQTGQKRSKMKCEVGTFQICKFNEGQNQAAATQGPARTTRPDAPRSRSATGQPATGQPADEAPSDLGGDDVPF